MFTVLAERVVTLLAEVPAVFLHDVESDLAQSNHPLMVLAEPSTLALAIIGAGVFAVTQRARRKRQRTTHVARIGKKDSQKADEIPKRGAA